jgi:hypothetical protein
LCLIDQHQFVIAYYHLQFSGGLVGKRPADVRLVAVQVKRGNSGVLLYSLDQRGLAHLPGTVNDDCLPFEQGLLDNCLDFSFDHNDTHINYKLGTTFLLLYGLF